MKNEDQKKTEQLQLELLKLKIGQMRTDLYKNLSKEIDAFSNKPIFNKNWLKKQIFGENNEKMFDV